MSSTHFRITSHTLEASHIRGFARATSTHQEEVLHLAIKQYTPLDHVARPGDVTIIAAHANGFPKELYEPLWDELLSRCKTYGFGIRGIWIADVVSQGASGVLNEEKLGNDPSWLDHSRDLLHMINIFRAEMPRPFVGIGHSMGGCQLASLALLHPRLFETIILIDPVIQASMSVIANIGPAAASTRRRERWPSRAEAAKAFRKSPFYQTWDPRVLDRWLEFGLRDLPTKSLPDFGPPEVTLATTRDQEVLTFLRPNYAPRPGDAEASSAEYSFSNPKLNRRTQPDIAPATHPQTPFYRGESSTVFYQLPQIRPSVFYVFGSKSFLTDDVNIEQKLATTGTGIGGSGGRAEGQVDSVMVQDAGHLIPMERVEQTAEHIGRWIGTQMIKSRDWDAKTEQEWGDKIGIARSKLTERFVKELNTLAKPKAARPKL